MKIGGKNKNWLCCAAVVVMVVVFVVRERNRICDLFFTYNLISVCIMYICGTVLYKM